MLEDYNIEIHNSKFVECRECKEIGKQGNAARFRNAQRESPLKFHRAVQCTIRRLSGSTCDALTCSNALLTNPLIQFRAK